MHESTINVYLIEFTFLIKRYTKLCTVLTIKINGNDIIFRVYKLLAS